MKDNLPYPKHEHTPEGIKLTEPTKYDEGKLRWDLVPWRQLEKVVKVIDHGATKYAPDNWKGLGADRWFAAALRHLTAWKEGEKGDEDSGLDHLAHAACSILFLMWTDDHNASFGMSILEQQKENQRTIDEAVRKGSREDNDLRDRVTFNLARRADGWDRVECCVFCQSLLCSEGCEGYARQQYILNNTVPKGKGSE